MVHGVVDLLPVQGCIGVTCGAYRQGLFTTPSMPQQLSYSSDVLAVHIGAYVVMQCIIRFVDS